MKVLDRVHIGSDKIPGIIIEVDNDYRIVDTILAGCFKVHVDKLELMPEPKGLLTIKSQIPEEKIKDIKSMWTLMVEKERGN